ncbi:Potassium channel kor1 [Thalictrum thalictroides]|uniref:Potassium channel kor1 n=1 Tax=Thalictrum thalictroides TaxID=46969 RepID=A0A7J6V2W8_THATH|nr:Potassium channel kor1 [Thalictrum thalictroides]
MQECRLYHIWTQFILIWAVYSSFFTPIEFGFFRGLPKDLLFLDIAGQIAFLFDIVIQFFVAYRDSQTYLMVTKRTPIGLRSVSPPFMIFVMIYVSFDMILGAYLIGNMTALIVKGSKTERFRDKMTDLTKYMNRNKLGKDIREQIKGHVRLQYESSYTQAAVLQDIPVSIRAIV